MWNESFEEHSSEAVRRNKITKSQGNNGITGGTTFLPTRYSAFGKSTLEFWRIFEKSSIQRKKQTWLNVALCWGNYKWEFWSAFEILKHGKQKPLLTLTHILRGQLVFFLSVLYSIIMKNTTLVSIYYIGDSFV